MKLGLRKSNRFLDFMKKLCIFDLDGTLTNTLGSISYFLNSELEMRGLPLVSPKDIKEFTGDGARNLVERVLKKNKINDGKLLDEICSSYVASYDKDYLYLCKLYPGIKEMVEHLEEEGVLLSCLTNKPHSTAVSIIEHFFGSSFSFVCGQRQGFPIKPDPSGALEIMKHFGLEAKDALYIGDTATDISTGKNAKCFTIGVLWGFRDMAELQEAGADAIIKEPREIAKFL